MLKKVFTILTLLIFIYSQVGFYIVIRNTLQSWKRSVKEDIFREIGDEQLTIISFTENKSKIHWEDDDQKEFVFNGEMYDIVKVVEKHGSTYLYCLIDKQEKKLIAEHNAVAKNHAHGKRTASVSFITLFNPEFADILILSQALPGIDFHPFIVQIPAANTDILSPPQKFPETVFSYICC